mgnify:CR=1 FL=1
MNNSKESVVLKIRNWIKQSLLIKISNIGLIIILLMIPNTLIKDLIQERNRNQRSVIQEVSSKWGNRQQIVGPVLTIPYKTYFENKDGDVFESIKYSHFLPEQLKINGEINPENRQRGIYNVVLYQALINCQGTFEQPDFEKFGIENDNILLDKAFLQVSIPDMGGINDEIAIKFNDHSYRMEPGIEKINGFNSGVKIPVVINPEQNDLAFNFNLNLNGSNALTFGPIGKETIVVLNSKWGSPSFMGSFLPDDHTVTEDGFTATWKILDLNRNYPQSWINEKQNLLQSSFGLELMQPVDEYAKNFRSAKYALLVISLTFLLFFFFEVLNKQKVHPMHYIFIGLAISIFYILLLSLSEHLGFNTAYFISSWAIIGLIGTYSSTILETKFLAVVLSAILCAIFAFIYTILQLEDFALLAGSIGLLLVLASVMYYSRNIDWNKIGKVGAEVGGEIQPVGE